MAINLVTKFSPLVDEKFTAESKTSIVTNKDYDFIGTHSLKIYSVGVAEMNDYGRNTDGTARYGTVKDLSTETQEVSMEKDRSFTFAIDKMDEDETLGALNAGSALARQLREVVIPEVDKYTYEKMATNAGTTKEETITKENAYAAILAGTETFDDNKRVVLPNNIRKYILNEMKSRLYNPADKTFEDRQKFRNYINTPIKYATEGGRLDFGDKIVEENLSLPSTSDAFPRGRYGIFDGFISDVDYLSGLAFSIRNNIKHQFSNLIEIFRSKKDSFGKFIYPDKETKIIIKGADDVQMEYEVVHELFFAAYGTEIHWNASRIVPTSDEIEKLNVLNKYDQFARISYQKIYLDEIDGVNSIEYTQDSQIRQIILKDEKLYEISSELLHTKEENLSNHRQK